MSRALASMFALAVLSACSQAEDCAQDAWTGGDAADAGADDAGADAAGIDAGPDDCPGSPGAFGIGPLVEVLGPSESSPYSDTDTRIVHFALYRRGETTPLSEWDASGATVFATQPMIDGEYELAVSVGGYAIGTERTHPEHCSSSGSDALNCPTVSFAIRRCRATFLAIALYCDPGLGPCPDPAWPFPYR